MVILDGDWLAGIITERDIVHAMADRRDLADGTAGDYMTWSRPPSAWAPLAEVARTMLALACATCRWWWLQRWIGMVLG